MLDRIASDAQLHDDEFLNELFNSHFAEDALAATINNIPFTNEVVAIEAQRVDCPEYHVLDPIPGQSNAEAWDFNIFPDTVVESYGNELVDLGAALQLPSICDKRVISVQ